MGFCVCSLKRMKMFSCFKQTANPKRAMKIRLYNHIQFLILASKKILLIARLYFVEYLLWTSQKLCRKVANKLVLTNLSKISHAYIAVSVDFLGPKFTSFLSLCSDTLNAAIYTIERARFERRATSIPSFTSFPLGRKKPSIHSPMAAEKISFWKIK